MTKEITKSIILQELQDKFGLREYEAAAFLFSETVVPVYDLGYHLLRGKVKMATLSITSTGGKMFFDVPSNERWYLHGYNVIFITGAYTVAGVMVYRPTNTEWLYIDLKAGQSVSYAYTMPKSLVLEPNDNLAVNIDGYTSTGNLELRADVSVEEVR